MIRQTQYQSMVWPSGIVGLKASDDGTLEQSASLPQELPDGFQQSMFAGLTVLVSSKCQSGLPVSLVYFRDDAQRYFQSLGRQTTVAGADWLSPDVPDHETLDELAGRAPPMLGLEYLSADSLRAMWLGLDQYTQAQVAAIKGGLASYLLSLRPD